MTSKAGEKFAKAEQERFHALQKRIQTLEEIFDGDPDANTPGYSAMLDRTIAAAKAVVDANKGLAERVRRLEAFLAPAMDGTTPPMDGAVVATKAHVDQALDRLAGALRGEMAVATDRQKRKVAP